MTQASLARSFGDRIVETGGRTTGFDYLRVGLAFGVIFWHSFRIAYGGYPLQDLVSGPMRAIYVFILPAFFGLSGFLVAGSLERNRSLIKFASLRILRIAPALTVEVVLSALLLGTALTTLPLSEYFRHPEFHRYFLNMIGDIQFTLPGVFHDNPSPNVVNGQLWTVPFELKCYLLLGAVAALGVVRRRWLFLLFVVALQVHDLAQHLHAHAGQPLGYGGISGWRLVLAFLDGVLLFRFRDLIPYSRPMYFVSLGLSFVLFALPLGDILAVPVVVFATAFTGLLNPKANVLVKFGDLSYGVYLYGYAIQQFVSSWGDWTHEWYLNLLFTAPIVTLIACFSWYVVEKPALSLRTHLKVFDPVDRAISAAQDRVIRGAKGVAGPLLEWGRSKPFVARLFAPS